MQKIVKDIMAMLRKNVPSNVIEERIRSLSTLIEGYSILVKKSDKKTILEWSTLLKDQDIEIQWEQFKGIASKVDFIRFLDPGIGSFLKMLCCI